MSQSPTPYYSPQPPSGPGNSHHPALASARRASVLMFILGGLAGVFGLLVGAAVWVVPNDQLEAIRHQPGMPPEMTIDLLRVLYTVIGAIMLGGGIAFCVMAVFVRKGSKGATITSIVLSILVLLFLGCNILGLFTQLGGGPQAIFTLVIILIPVGLLIWLLTSLFAANSAIGRLGQSQYQSQFGPTQQMYGQVPSQQPQNWQNPGGPWSGPGSWPPPPPPA